MKIHDYDNLEFLDSYYLEPNQKSVDKETNIEAGEYYISLMFFNSQHHS